jgi:hypothetical protein
MSSPTSSPRPRRREKTVSFKAGEDPFACPLTPQANMSTPGSAGFSPISVSLPMTNGMHPLQMSPRSPCSFTPEQQLQIDAMREQVRALEIVYQEAVEKNWPKDDLCKATEDKRRELQGLMMRFRTENAPFGLLHSRRLSEPADGFMLNDAAPSF